MPHSGMRLNRETGQRDMGLKGHKAWAQEVKSVSPSLPHASGPDVYQVCPHRCSIAGGLCLQSKLGHL